MDPAHTHPDYVPPCPECPFPPPVMPRVRYRDPASTILSTTPRATLTQINKRPHPAPQTTSPAACPDAQAHWKLKPPSWPVTSTTSPMKYSPG